MDNQSFERLPQAKIRMREGGLALLEKALAEGKHLLTGKPHVSIMDGNVYIQIPMNVETNSTIVFLGLDVLIPFNSQVQESPEPTTEAPEVSHEQETSETAA